MSLLPSAYALRVHPISTGNRTADAAFIAAEGMWFSGKVADCKNALQTVATNYAGTKAGLRVLRIQVRI